MSNPKRLSKDEEKILSEIRKRFAGGQRDYGELDLDNDPRDFTTEAMEEILDAIIYISIKLEKIKRTNEKRSSEEDRRSTEGSQRNSGCSV